MDFRIIAAAKPSIAYARDGVKFFEERLRPLGRVELRYVKAGDSESVSARLLEAREGCLRSDGLVRELPPSSPYSHGNGSRGKDHCTYARSRN